MGEKFLFAWGGSARLMAELIIIRKSSLASAAAAKPPRRLGLFL
jgi:hypothetical protein